MNSNIEEIDRVVEGGWFNFVSKSRTRRWDNYITSSRFPIFNFSSNVFNVNFLFQCGFSSEYVVYLRRLTFSNVHG